MPYFYSKKLKGTLQDAVEAALQQDPSEVLALYEELAIVRTTALDVIRLYEAALESNDASAACTVGIAVRGVMKDVAEMVKNAAELEYKRADKLSVHNLAMVVNQIVRISAEVFGDDMEKAEEFRKLVIEQLKVDKGGTDITPDQDAADMDATVPHA